MFKKQLALIVIVCATWACNLQAWDCAWVGGEFGYWEDQGNWSCGLIPSFGDEVVTIDSISNGVDKITVGVQMNHIIERLDSYGKVELAKMTYGPVTLFFADYPYQSDMNCLTNHGDLSIEIDIRGDVTNIAGATLELGEHINIFGDLHNELGGTITVDMTNIDVEEGGEVYNDGLIRCIANGGIGETPHFHNNGQIWLYASSVNGAIFENNANSTITGCGVISAGSLAQNKGTICASMGALLIYISEGSLMNTGILKNDVGATLNVHAPTDANNKGSIETNAGGAMTFDCNLRNEPNGIIKLLGGTLGATTITQKADANFAGFGGITGDVIIDPDGIIKLTGPTNIVGDVEIKNDATLEVSDGLTLITGKTTCNGTIHIKGGYCLPQGGLTGNCNVIWEPGLYTNVADFNLDGQVNLKDFAYFADTWLWQSAWR